MLEPTESIKVKSFWRKPEGTTGMIILAIAAIAAAFGINAILPWIISLLQNTIHAVILFAVVGVLFFILTNRRFWNLVKYIFKSIARAITGVFITIDPIGILKNYISSLGRSIDQMKEQIGELRGQMRALQQEILTNEKIREDSLKQAKIAKASGKQSAFVLKARKAGRLKESNMTFQNLYVKMELLYRVLTKMLEAAQFWYEDLSDEVDVKARERKMITKGYSVYKNAKKVIQGDPDARELFDQTLEYLADDYAQKLGEIENFMDISQGFIESVDIKNGVYEEEALKELEEWEKKTDSLILGDEKETLLLQAADKDDILDLDAPLPEVSRDEVLAEKKKRQESKENKYKEFMQ